MPENIVIVSSGPYGPDSPAEVRVMFGAGGCLKLPSSTFAQAMRDAEAWSIALHREACGGCVLIAV